MKNTMKIILFLSIFISTSTFSIGVPDQNRPWKFNYEFNDALKYEWQIKVQEKSGMSLFDEAREEVQNILKTPKWTKTTQLIHTMGNTFCRGFYGTCDQNSLYARLISACGIARDTALKKMESNYVKNNTQLLIASYSTCFKLADDVILAYKDSASIAISQWNKEEIVTSQETFMEKSQDSFQEKVSNVWDVYTKKLTNFVRSVQGITRNVNVRW